MSTKRPDPLKDRPTEDQQIDVLQALRTAPDHMLAITAAADVDYALETVIRERFRIDNDEDARTFDGAQNGFLAAASSKITIAYAAGFIEKTSRDDLRIINKVGNIFAHSMHQIDFKHTEVSARCRKLSLVQRRSDMFPDAAIADPHSSYWITCLDFFAVWQFQRRGIREGGRKAALPIAERTMWTVLGINGGWWPRSL
ncbi:hypothetical protein [Bradyrhizobium sp. Cp5.3]|uniref:hypothetical protein n=1 Tax=Bradyrhizobium sp. Cp5.3 TaxID=443598 RepID=UPI00048A1C10|nr:hypothetical protein [Bradyrhizobium sp. Cp5.3]